MRSPPVDLAPGRVARAVADGWRLRAVSIRHVPRGGGAFHWKVTGDDGLSWFVTVDDLDGKDWIGDTRQAVLGGLGRALAAAAALRHDAGLGFVVAPVAARDGQLVHRLDDRYAVSVFPFLTGRSYPFGRYADPQLRGQVLQMIAAVHRSTPAVAGRAPGHVLGYAGRDDLRAFLADPGRAWDGGPFSESARHLLLPRAAGLGRLADGFDRQAGLAGLTGLTAPGRAGQVITHGEPHPANLMSAGTGLLLVDWDTTALAPPERDLSLIITGSQDAERYHQATGHHPDPAVLALYRLRWYLDDLASAVRLFRSRHRDTADTRRWRDGLPARLEELPRWLKLLG